MSAAQRQYTEKSLKQVNAGSGMLGNVAAHAYPVMQAAIAQNALGPQKAVTIGVYPPARDALQFAP